MYVSEGRKRMLVRVGNMWDCVRDCVRVCNVY